MIKNIFFDRDGIINEVVIRDNVVSSPRTTFEFKVRDEFLTFYKDLKLEYNLNLFVFSNQPDIARGLLLKKDLDVMTEQIKKLFQFQEIVYCTHDDKDNCDCRKPKSGMLEYLINKYKLKREESIIIGDSIKDILAGNSASISVVLLKTEYNEKVIIDQPDLAVKSLYEILNLLSTK